MSETAELVRMVERLAAQGLVRADAPADARALMDNPGRLLAFVQTQVDMAQTRKARRRAKSRSRSRSPPRRSVMSVMPVLPPSPSLSPPPSPPPSPPRPSSPSPPQPSQSSILAWVSTGRDDSADPLGLLRYVHDRIPLVSELDVLSYIMTAQTSDCSSAAVMHVLRNFVRGLVAARAALETRASLEARVPSPAHTSTHAAYTTVRSVHDHLTAVVLPDLWKVEWVRAFLLCNFFT